MAGKGKVCGSEDVRVAGLWDKEGAGLRVLKNGDGEERERVGGRTEGWERRRSGK